MRCIKVRGRKKWYCQNEDYLYTYWLNNPVTNDRKKSQMMRWGGKCWEQILWSWRSCSEKKLGLCAFMRRIKAHKIYRMGHDPTNKFYTFMCVYAHIKFIGAVRSFIWRLCFHMRLSGGTQYVPLKNSLHWKGSIRVQGWLQAHNTSYATVYTNSSQNLLLSVSSKLSLYSLDREYEERCSLWMIRIQIWSVLLILQLSSSTSASG
jgi:hypothetical protein